MLYIARDYFFGTLTNKTRLQILDLLRKSPKNVTQICKELKIDQTTISHNLKRLKTCNFVHSKKNGKERIYSINNETIEPLMKLVDKHASHYCKECVGR